MIHFLNCGLNSRQNSPLFDAFWFGPLNTGQFVCLWHGNQNSEKNGPLYKYSQMLCYLFDLDSRTDHKYYTKLHKQAQAQEYLGKSINNLVIFICPRRGLNSDLFDRKQACYQLSHPRFLSSTVVC